MKKIFIIITLFLLGARLLDKYAMVHPVYERISYGDILFALYIVLSFIRNFNHSSRWVVTYYSRHHKIFTISLFAFAMWTGVSWAINTMVAEGYILDFFGIPVRVAWYGLMSLFVAKWVYDYGPNMVITPFCTGILAMFYYNFLSVALGISGIPLAIPENNFSGVLMPACAIYFSLSLLYKPQLLPMILLYLSVISTFLIYSLGAIILIILALPAVWISIKYSFFTQTIRAHKRILFFILLLPLCIWSLRMLNPYTDTISQHILRKIHNIPGIEGTQIESAHMRFGHFLSSMLITIQNPLFGVGEANWEAENDKNEWVGEWYCQNEDPHNGLAQIMSMSGIPAFFLFSICLYCAFKGLYNLRLLNGSKWRIFVWSVALVFFCSANIMDAIFTTYYFYFFAALIFGISARVRGSCGKYRKTSPMEWKPYQ